MRVTIDKNDEQYLESELRTINEWWIKATSQIYQENRLIYCVEIDGQPMYEEYEKIISDNFNLIHEINVVTKTKQESIKETESTIHEYLDRFISASRAIADSFYGALTEEHWGEFSQFIEGLNWIVNSLEFLRVLSVSKNSDVTSALQQLEQVIEELEQSLQRQEYVYVGDLIQYELVPILQNYKSRIA